MGNGLDRLRSTVAHFGVKKPDLTGLENTNCPRHLIGPCYPKSDCGHETHCKQQRHSHTCLARIMIFIKFDVFIFIVLEERWRVDFHIRWGWPWLEVIEFMRGPWFFIHVTRITVALKRLWSSNPFRAVKPIR
jgi:hypothetical protein